MLIGLLAASTLTASVTLDVPYLPQTEALCGGAAMAMVYRYWGDTHAGVKQFAPLVDRRAGGIADTVLVEAVRQHGWSAVQFDGSLERVRTHLAARQPIIVLLADRRDRYHYVVVIGSTPDRMVIHDPSWGPSRSIPVADFVRRWKATNFWSLLVLPPAGGTIAQTRRDEPERAPSNSQPVARCAALLSDAIASIGRLGMDRAEAILDRVQADCPESSGPLRELAGVRFEQGRWSDAVALAHKALALDPTDSYAWDVLGSSLFMQNDSTGALRAWNRIGRPRLNTVRLAGLQRTRYEIVAQSLHVEPGALLTAEAFDRARRLLNELPDRADSRLTLRPEADGFASLDIVLRERPARPRGSTEWVAASAQAGFDREISATIPGATGQGEVWTAAWRWWEDRPRVAVSFAAPRRGRLPGVWRVDGSWDTQTYALATMAAERLRESRVHGAASFSSWMAGSLRYSFTGGIDSWNGARRDALVGASLEHRSPRDSISIATEATRWIPLSGDRGFSSLAARVQLRAPAAAQRWEYRAGAGLERTTDTAPLALWGGAGEGRVRAPLLRAHPLLTGGIVNAGSDSAFGRTLMGGTVEARRWLDRPQLPQIGLAMFSDVARTSRSSANESLFNVDLGAGVRIRVPGWQSTLRVDVAHGLRDGRHALTFGWLF
jgi:tetratricopeptide (TPR) repeat protein